MDAGTQAAAAACTHGLQQQAELPGHGWLHACNKASHNAGNNGSNNVPKSGGMRAVGCVLTTRTPRNARRGGSSGSTAAVPRGAGRRGSWHSAPCCDLVVSASDENVLTLPTKLLSLVLPRTGWGESGLLWRPDDRSATDKVHELADRLRSVDASPKELGKALVVAKPVFNGAAAPRSFEHFLNTVATAINKPSKTNTDTAIAACEVLRKEFAGACARTTRSSAAEGPHDANEQPS